MNPTPVGTLRAVLPHLPRALAQESSLQALERLACRLEGLSCSAFYLECRLAPRTEQLDLLAQVRPKPTQQRRGQSWVSRGLAAGAPSLWLEFDDAGAEAGQAKLPGLHIRLDDQNGDPALPFDRARAVSKLEQLWDDAIVDAEVCAAMTRCVTELPDAGRVIHASVMPARVPAESKLYVALPTSVLSDYFARVGWARDWGDPASLLGDFIRAELTGDTLYCDLTFRPALAPSIGLVYSQWHVKTGVSDASRAVVRALLVKSGLCSEAQSAALARWMHGQDAGLISRAPAEFCRCLDLKVRARRGLGLDAKAYLGFAPAGDSLR